MIRPAAQGYWPADILHLVGSQAQDDRKVLRKAFRNLQLEYQCLYMRQVPWRIQTREYRRTIACQEIKIHEQAVKSARIISGQGLGADRFIEDPPQQRPFEAVQQLRRSCIRGIPAPQLKI